MDFLNQRSKIPVKYIIELGLIRKRDKCAKCGEKMDVKDYHIQLCKKCRSKELDKYASNILNKDDKTPRFAKTKRSEK